MATPNQDIPTQYDSAATERAWYERWTAADVFSPKASDSCRTSDNPQSCKDGSAKNPFTIVMPPPNVTAVLHMGHGLNDTVQDVITRWRRMAGDAALWLPGTDHAGIATQNVVERQLGTEGKTRFDVGREAFLLKTADFVKQTGGIILDQVKSIGGSCDWDRTAYTLDEGPSSAVREAFVQLYERGLVYKGNRVIHWCSRCLTSLSDEEAEHSDETGALYHLSYPLSDGSGQSIIVATTRPETMLGDVAVAVHPDDPRYASLIGKTLTLPIANVDIPIVADTYVDPEFGTGAVKITPAHDPNDFEVGKRHALPMPIIMTPEGLLDNFSEAGERVPSNLKGVDRFEARKKIVEILKASGNLIKVETHQHAVRRCYRCNTVVEPRLSDQWFVSMKELAAPALEAVRSRKVRIVPDRWEAVYIHWLENIRDWNISRQLWWGHRIPVWYDKDGNVIVSRTTPENAHELRQDEDVLDTWFSSWLWPLSTLGWPNKESADLKAFYPTDFLITAPEILFFWVSRMIMAGYAFMDETPFHTVYLHGTVRDTNHVKMSKSLGNGIDPMDVVQLYGADALRYTVISGLGMGADLILDPNDLEKSFSPGRNFATKLWNIGRFLLSNVGTDSVDTIDSVDDSKFTRADRWILGRLNVAINECNAALGPARPNRDVWDEKDLNSGLRLNEYIETARRFVWNEVADWYLETTKARMAAGGEDREVARIVLVHVFDNALRLLHPVVPFITEELWQKLPRNAERPAEFITITNWPVENPRFQSNSEFETVRDVINALRAKRAEYAVAPGKVIDAFVIPDARSGFITEEINLIRNLTRSNLKVETGVDDPNAAHALLPDGTQIIVPLGDLVDMEKECAKLQKDLEQLEKQLAALTGRLSNPGFVDRAPANVVEAERAKQADWTTRCDQMRAKISSLCGSRG